jgi:hypothetical protein
MAQEAMSDMGLDFGLNSMIRDELEVEDLGNPDGMEMVLRTPDNIKWWKSLSYFMAVQGGSGVGPEIRIETKDNVHEAKQYLFGAALSSQGVFELWKGGFGGFGAFAGALPVNAWANRQRRIIFTWIQD